MYKLFCIAFGDSVFDARSAARTGDFCFGKSHQNHFAPSSHPIPRALRVGWGALRSSVGEGVFRQDILSCEKRAHPMRAPQDGTLRASSSPTCGARCDSRDGEHLNQAHPSKPKTQHLEDSDVGGVDVPTLPARRASQAETEQARQGRVREARVGRRTGVLSANPRLGREAQGGFAPEGKRFFGYFLVATRKYPARGAGTAII